MDNSQGSYRLEDELKELLRRREEGAVVGVHGQHLTRQPPADHGLLLLRLYHVVLRRRYVHTPHVVDRAPFAFAIDAAASEPGSTQCCWPWTKQDRVQQTLDQPLGGSAGTRSCAGTPPAAPRPSADDRLPAQM